MVALPHKCESPSLLYIILIFYTYKIITMTQFLYIYFRRNFLSPRSSNNIGPQTRLESAQPSCNGEKCHHISSIAFLRHHIIHFFFFNLLFFNLLLKGSFALHSPQRLGGDNAFLLLPLRRLYYLNFLRGIFRKRNL